MVGIGITMESVLIIEKRSHESINKTEQKIYAKRLRATTFTIAKLEDH